MKLKYLGTAAAEGIPALFCNCKHCVSARALGGKNIRTRSQSLVNDNLLIDFPQDTYMHFLNNGIEGDKIEYLLITHAHQDHCYIRDLFVRRSPYAHEMRVPTLKLFCSEYVYKTFDMTFPQNVEITILKAYETVEFGEYKVTPLPANHMKGCEPFIYIIESDKTLLYAHDTGNFFEEVFEYIEKNKLRFDMVTLDCTNVLDFAPDGSGHMGFPNNEKVLNRLASLGAIDDNTIKCVNHFSHNGGPIHEIIEEKAGQNGWLVSYDGFEVNI